MMSEKTSNRETPFPEDIIMSPFFLAANQEMFWSSKVGSYLM